MEIVASLIKLFFGSKADKDRKQIEPYLEKIKAVYPSIEALSNDELRDRSEALKKQIADFIARDEADIVERLPEGHGYGVLQLRAPHRRMLPSTEGMACIERVPLAYMRLKQRPPRISESRNGVKPLVSRPA